MVRLIGNVLVSGLAIILLSSCAAGVKVIDTYTIEKKREPLALEDPKPLELQDITISDNLSIAISSLWSISSPVLASFLSSAISVLRFSISDISYIFIYSDS